MLTFNLRKNLWAKFIFAFFLLITSQAQANTLTMDWTQLNPAMAPSARDTPSVAYDSVSGALILFGGSSNGISLNDTWTFNTVTNTWTQQNISGTLPPPRTAANLVFEPCTGRVILFGGSNNGTPLGDTWALDFNTVNNTYSWTNLSPSNPPAPRYGSSMDFDPCSGQIILFSGYNGTTYFNDTWAFDTRNNVNTWTNLNPSNPPPGRQASSTLFDPANGQIIIFGGIGADGLMNDTWGFNTIAGVNTWTNLNPSNPPSARYGASITFNPFMGLLVLFGGKDASGLLNETWTFNAVNGVNVWNEVTEATSPSPRYGASMDFDLASGQMILFGGSGNSGDLGDTWAYGVPSNAVLFWKDVNPPPSQAPEARYGHCTAFDPRTGKIILFGGTTNSSVYLNDTWEYHAASGTWTEINTATLPHARDSAVMMFNPCSGQIIMFGGLYVDTHGNYFPYNDVWALTYDSTTKIYNWVEVTPTSNPSPNPVTGSSMTFDAASGQCILFGGYDNYQNADQPYTWGLGYEPGSNIYTWTQLTFSTTIPPLRDSSFMVFDPTTGKCLLFGGYDGVSLGDTWVFNGKTNTWTQKSQSAAISPEVRFGTRMDFFPCTGQVILYGGGYQNPNPPMPFVYGDTWDYDGEADTWTELFPINPPQAREFSSASFDPLSGQIITFGGDQLGMDPITGLTEALGLGLPPQITSPDTTTFGVGEPSSFTVTTTGYPDPVITETGALPPGITFVDNGDGTATLSGTPAPGTVGVYTFTITANNGLPSAVSQTFTLVIGVFPPTNFTATLRKNKFLTQTQYIVKAKWDPSPSGDIAYYRIYRKGHLIGRVSASSKLIFITSVGTKREAKELKIVAVNSANFASAPVSIKIVKDSGGHRF